MATQNYLSSLMAAALMMSPRHKVSQLVRKRKFNGSKHFARKKQRRLMQKLSRRLNRRAGMSGRTQRHRIK